MPNAYQTHRRQLYILPTKTGWILGLIIFALLIAAIKYSHQGIFLLTFLLASMGQVTALYTHKNLLKIRLSANHAQAVYAGETAQFPVQIENNSTHDKHAIWVLCNTYHQHISLPAQHSQTVLINIPTTQRGQLTIPDIILSSHYPIGILFSWSKAFAAQARCTVYPEPKNLINMPELTVSHDEYPDNAAQTTTELGNDEFSTLKPYQPSDRLRDIHWPALAKSQTLISKQFADMHSATQIFHWNHVKTLPIEDKLSQLTYWINEAEKQQQRYQLVVPGFTSQLDNGAAHQHTCLSALANWANDREAS